MTDFVHLHTHSDFSVLDGYGQVSEYAKKCVERKIPYLCITDHGMGAAYPRMIEECSKINIKPIFGSELYVNNYHHLVPSFKDLTEEEKYKVRKSNHLILIAKNNKGYENLVKLISTGWIDGFYYKPRINWELIKKYSEGLICSSACMGGELQQYILNENYPAAIDFIKKYKDLFGEDFYLELQMIKMKEQDIINKTFIALSNKYNIPLILTNDVHYCEEKEAFNQDIMLLLNSKSTINNRGNGLEFHTNQLWYKSVEELDSLWNELYKDDIPEAEYKEAKKNTVRICEKCDVQIDTAPKFPQIENAREQLMDFCIASLKKHHRYSDKIYRDRFLKEYKLICEKDFESYFLCVKKIIDYARSIGSDVGPGRGSCAGSLISYLLDITGIDPIKWNLLFERFLSPSRGGKSVKLQFPEGSEIK